MKFYFKLFSNGINLYLSSLDAFLRTVQCAFLGVMQSLLQTNIENKCLGHCYVLVYYVSNNS